MFSSAFVKPLLACISFVGFLFFSRLFLCSETLGLDEAEQVIYAQIFLPGYPSQPPLYTWLQILFFKFTGANLFGLACLKYSLILTCLITFHCICSSYFQNKKWAWVATLSWALIPNISYDLLPHRTHVLLALTCVCLTWYWLICRLHSFEWKSYLLFGFIVSMGLLSKFNYGLFLLAFLCAAFSIPTYRHRLLNAKMALTITVVVLLCLPYATWLSQHMQVGLYTTYKLNVAHKTLFQGMIRLISTVACFVLPSLLVWFFGKPSLRTAFILPHQQLLLRYHITIGLILCILVVFAKVYTLKTHWLLPLLCFLPLLALSFVERFSLQKMRSYFLLCFAIQAISCGIWISRTPYLATLPWEGFAKQIQENTTEKTLVSNSHWLLGNLMVRLHFPHGILLYPKPFPDLPKGKTWLIWEGEKNPQLELQQMAAHAELEEPFLMHQDKHLLLRQWVVHWLSD